MAQPIQPPTGCHPSELGCRLPGPYLAYGPQDLSESAAGPRMIAGIRGADQRSSGSPLPAGVQPARRRHYKRSYRMGGNPDVPRVNHLRENQYMRAVLRPRLRYRLSKKVAAFHGPGFKEFA